MFDILFQGKKKEIQSYMDVISIEITKLQISKLAIEKAVGMIAHAIAKSEFIVQRGSERAKDHLYWVLNKQPNPNETATDFWIQVIRRLLIEGECLICDIGQNLYIADEYSNNNTVMLPQTYRSVNITSNGGNLMLQRAFSAGDIIHLKAQNKKIREYLESVLRLYDNTASAVAAAKKLASRIFQ